MADHAPATALGSIYDGRPEFVSQDTLDEAADAFIRSIGWGNQERFSRNLTNVVQASDVMRALNRALVGNFNSWRQDQIRQENERYT